VVSRVRRELALGEFEYGLALIVKIEGPLNLEIDTLTVIRHPAIGVERISAHTHMHLRRTRIEKPHANRLGGGFEGWGLFDGYV
jgi:hypothetical protein